MVTHLVSQLVLRSWLEDNQSLNDIEEYHLPHHLATALDHVIPARGGATTWSSFSRELSDSYSDNFGCHFH